MGGPDVLFSVRKSSRQDSCCCAQVSTNPGPCPRGWRHGLPSATGKDRVSSGEHVDRNLLQSAFERSDSTPWEDLFCHHQVDVLLSEREHSACATWEGRFLVVEEFQLDVLGSDYKRSHCSLAVNDVDDSAQLRLFVCPQMTSERVGKASKETGFSKRISSRATEKDSALCDPFAVQGEHLRHRDSVCHFTNYYLQHGAPDSSSNSFRACCGPDADARGQFHNFSKLEMFKRINHVQNPTRQFHCSHNRFIVRGSPETCRPRVAPGETFCHRTVFQEKEVDSGRDGSAGEGRGTHTLGGRDRCGDGGTHEPRRPVTSPHGRRRQQWLPLLLLVMMSTFFSGCRPVGGTVSLPVPAPPLHPRHFLTSAGPGSGFLSEGALTSNAVEGEGEPQQAVRESEVMYHFYKNGRLGAAYRRKASTLFMVSLFNDLLKGSPAVRASLRSGPRESRNGSNSGAGDARERPSSTDTIRGFSAGEVQYSTKKATVVFFVPYLPPNERLRSAELRFLRQKKSGSKRADGKVKRLKLRIDVFRGGKRVEKIVLREKGHQHEDYDVLDVTRVLDPWINTHHGNVTLKVLVPRKLEEKIVLKDATGSLQSTSLVALYLEDREFLKNMYQSYTTDGERLSGESDKNDDDDYVPDFLHNRNSSEVEPRRSQRPRRATREKINNSYLNQTLPLDQMGASFEKFFQRGSLDWSLDRDVIRHKHRRSKRNSAVSSSSSSSSAVSPPSASSSSFLPSSSLQPPERDPKLRRKQRNGGSGGGTAGKRNRWYKASKNDECQMYDFKVDFDLIGWGQWIIHPKQFNAGFCYGECPSPVDSKFKPTNHAMLQTLMRQKRPRLAPPTCCVPIRLKALSMLYFEYDEIVVRHHEDMVAAECGCR